MQTEIGKTFLGAVSPPILGLGPFGYYPKSARWAKGEDPFTTVSPQGHFPVVLTE